MAQLKGYKMNIITSELFEEQLKNILDDLVKIDFKMTKDFKMYLDTLILNIPTKVKKYKQSIYSEEENVKDLEFQDFTIPFLVDTQNNVYTILGIIKK